MKFSFNYSGGFAGLKYHLTDDSDNFDPALKVLFESMIRIDPDKLKPANPLAKDEFIYVLDVNDQHVHLKFIDDNIPDEFTPLISFLRQKSSLASI